VLKIDRVKAVLSKPPGWMPSRLLRDQLFALRSMFQLRRAKYRCDALLANGFVTWAESDLNSIHFVHASWRRHFPTTRPKGFNARETYRSLYALANEWLEKRALRRSRQVVAVSEAVRGELLQLGVAADRLHVVANGVDIDEFSPGPSQRAVFNLPEDVVIALFAGDIMTPRKNLDTVLRALQQTPGLHLAVAGKTAGSPYPAMARALDLQDRVHFLGFRPDMPALMRSVDIFVLPSRYEPFGLVILEAMASGLPVLTSRQAGIADCIEPEVGYILEDCDDAGTLAGWLGQLTASPERRRVMGASARRLAEAHCWPAMARHYVRLLVRAAELRGQPLQGQLKDA
jgi:glycosyltransferase involved in cell wall biosynthesis